MRMNTSRFQTFIQTVHISISHHNFGYYRKVAIHHRIKQPNQSRKLHSCCIVLVTTSTCPLIYVHGCACNFYCIYIFRIVKNSTNIISIAGYRHSANEIPKCLIQLTQYVQKKVHFREPLFMIAKDIKRVSVFDKESQLY